MGEDYSPMDGNIVLDMVDNLDEHVIAFSSIKGRARELAVHGHDGFGGAEPGCIFHHHLQKVTPW